MISGVYEIKNIVTGKRYIGSAVDLKRRWRQHGQRLKFGRHHNRHLQASWLKHGSSSFRFRLIRPCVRAYLLAFEQHYIDSLNPEYNICLSAGSILGVKRSAETKEKIAASLRGRTRPEFSQEWKDRIGAGTRGVKRTAETRAKMCLAQRARPDRRK